MNSTGHKHVGVTLSWSSHLPPFCSAELGGMEMDYGSAPEDDGGAGSPPPQPANDADADAADEVEGMEEEQDSPRTQLIKANIRLVGASQRVCSYAAVPPHEVGGRSSAGVGGELWRRPALATGRVSNCTTPQSSAAAGRRCPGGAHSHSGVHRWAASGSHRRQQSLGLPGGAAGE